MLSGCIAMDDEDEARVRLEDGRCLVTQMKMGRVGGGI
jgi:hypothetical protein